MCLPVLDAHPYPCRSVLGMAVGVLRHDSAYVLSLPKTCSKLLWFMDLVQTSSVLASKALVYLPTPVFSSSLFPISLTSCIGLLSVLRVCVAPCTAMS